MDAALEAIRDTRKAKTEAKTAVMVAIGEAKLAEKEGRTADAEAAWSVVAVKGYATGTEGEREAEAKAQALAYVESNPAIFAFYEVMSEADGVAVLEGARATGNEELLWRTQCWLWAAFDKQYVGGRGAARIPRSFRRAK